MDRLSLRLTFKRRGTGLSYPLHLMGLMTESTVVVTDKFEEPCEVWLAVELTLESSIVTKPEGKRDE